MSNKNSDITRRRDLSEKVTIALAMALLVCTGFHTPAAERVIVSVLGAPAGCTQVPAFTFHVEAGVADTTENLPSKGRSSSSAAVKKTTTTTTEPVPPPAP